MHTLTNPSLKDSWLAVRKENPRIRIRDAARQLGVSEAAILASFSGGNDVIRLAGDFRELWKRMPGLGYIMSLTRNESCVHERKGIFENVHAGSGHVGFVAGKDIDLRMFFRHWAFGFALRDNTAAGFKNSLQFFDQQGTAVIKIFLQEESDRDAFEKLTHDFTAADQSPLLETAPPAPSQAYADELVNEAAFREDWSRLKDTHDFFPMLKKHNISRLHALRIAGEFTRKIDAGSVKKLLYDASASGMEIMVFVGNPGNIQIHTGPVKNIVEIPGWINVMDPEFNLHLRTGDIAECWSVRKPTADSAVHSVEVFDAAGSLIVQFFGKRKPGIPELPEWAAYVNSLR
ncbi:hemin-degrading factor [Compostibacter hankyongensis]|uniref:Hemin-degrading factor n=1 Tax=Compostibacter hankyongensis TaxID=1007089 RepID=A0ABP8FQQ2_9BACT